MSLITLSIGYAGINKDSVDSMGQDRGFALNHSYKTASQKQIAWNKFYTCFINTPIQRNDFLSNCNSFLKSL